MKKNISKKENNTAEKESVIREMLESYTAVPPPPEILKLKRKRRKKVREMN